MTTERTYRCNLCRDMISGDSDGFGVYFTSSTDFKFTALHGSENHLCGDCVLRIATAQRAVVAMPVK